MTQTRSPLRPDRVRRLPPQFSWVDQRLVRDHWLAQCDCDTLALYLFLLTVADAQGLSFYGEASLCRHLPLTPPRLQRARHWLEYMDLIAWRAPLYQVLSLEVAP